MNEQRPSDPPVPSSSSPVVSPADPPQEKRAGAAAGGPGATGGASVPHSAISGLPLAARLAAEVACADVARRRVAVEVFRVDSAHELGGIDWRTRAAAESDPDLRRVCEHLAAVAAALPGIGAPEMSVEAIGARFGGLDVPGRVAWLRRFATGGGSRPLLLGAWRDAPALRSEKDPAVVAALLTLLTGQLTGQDVGLVGPWLDHAEHRVAAAALLAVAPVDPGAVRSRLPINLSSASFERVGAALTFMARDDVEEADHWIRALLADKLATTRYAALQGLSALPAARSRDAMVRLLTTDESPLLAALCARQLVTAASPAVLRSLAGLSVTSDPAADELLERTLAAVSARVDALDEGQEPATNQVARARRLADESRLAFYRRVLLNLVDGDDVDARLMALHLLASHQVSREVKDAWQRLGAQNTDPRVLTALGRPPAAPSANPPVLANAIGAATFSTLSLEQQLTVLGQVGDKRSFELLRPELPALLAAGQADPVRWTVLRLMDEFGVDTDATAAEPLLAGCSPEVQAAAIGVVGRLNASAGRQRLRELPPPAAPLPRAALIEALLPLDRRRALELLEGLLASGQPRAVRSLAMALLARVDFPAAETMVLQLVAGETDAALRGQATYWAAMNPTSDGLYLLYRLCHDDQGTVRSGMGEVWRIAGENARQAELVSGNPAQLAREFGQRLEGQRLRERNPPPYALSVILQHPVLQQPGESAWVAWARGQPMLAATLLGGVVGLVIFAFGMGFLKYSENRLTQMQTDLTRSSTAISAGGGLGSDFGAGTGLGLGGGFGSSRGSSLPQIDLSRFVGLDASGSLDFDRSHVATITSGLEDLEEARAMIATGEIELGAGILECLAEDPSIATATRREADRLRRELEPDLAAARSRAQGGRGGGMIGSGASFAPAPGAPVAAGSGAGPTASATP